MKSKEIFAIISCFLLTSCVPTYQLENTNKYALLDIKNIDNPRICQNGQFVEFPRYKNGFVRIPYGERIFVANDHYSSIGSIYYSVSESCFSGISFVPKPEQRYMLDFRIQNKTCMISVLREDPNNRLGYTVDSTARVENKILCDNLDSFR